MRAFYESNLALTDSPNPNFRCGLSMGGMLVGPAQSRAAPAAQSQGVRVAGGWGVGVGVGELVWEPWGGGPVTLPSAHSCGPANPCCARSPPLPRSFYDKDAPIYTMSRFLPPSKVMGAGGTPAPCPPQSRQLVAVHPQLPHCLCAAGCPLGCASYPRSLPA